jgi:hypothetical protein
MPEKNMSINSLLHAFPSVVSYYDFKENDREISRRAIPGIIKYAFNHSIIETASETAFVAFLEKYGKTDVTDKLPDGLTFSDVLNILSGNLSVNALIAQIEVTARELSLPEVQAPMITRLKKKFVINTPKKRALLRILAFKLAQKHPELNWHYDLLLQLPCFSADRFEAIQENSGVTIAFHLQGQGSIIFPSDVLWLKNELSSCITYLRLEQHLHKKNIEMIGATSFNLRTAKKPGPMEEHRLYNEAIRNVMAIAHQMSARWLLSEYSTPQKKLIIIIHAGIMTEANLTIQRILEFSLNAESGIYLTDFAHMCALYASVKAGFELYAKNSRRSTGYSGDIWSVSNFLSYSYFDYIPCLLEEKMLPRSIFDPSYEDFKRTLHFPEQAGYCSFGAIKAMHRFPQSALLLTEIAKVLRARLMPYEADAVLANLLLTSPLNLVARLMRMLIYSNIAQTHSDFLSAKLSFERAEAEGNFIVNYCEPKSDIWHEIGVMHFGRCIKYLKYLREKSPADRHKIQKHDLLNQLAKANDAFLKNMTASATGKTLSSLYMFGYTLCLSELLSAGKIPAGKSRDAVKTGIHRIFKSISMRIFRSIGWLRDEPIATDNKIEDTFQNLLITINMVIARYENLVLCRSNIPFIKYTVALALWDFTPAITPQICRMTLEWLRQAGNETENLIADNISVYHVAYGNISAEKFLHHIRDTIGAIYQYVTDDDLQQEHDSPLVQKKMKKLSDLKLMLLDLEHSCTETAVSST